MSINLIKVARDLKIKNFINMGSSCIYPPNKLKPNDEKALNGKLRSQMRLCAWKNCQYKNV